ncbi:hypothetical protein K469DRAFT_14220 [Zopfia rhizophila CBS 207.26]|uniref:Ubiquitin-like domain-containing protein n=1 Tax=Zopfia rhizophila CBS 207.26 TaxID=1314779 RepID=A0A6A6EWE7_9PEZI|nr:hypothetical protein K469DRAFT_14220 [Zopfia rhizophila CBS 207.26]
MRATSSPNQGSSIQVFNSFLEAQFRGLPGEQKVLRRQYLILDAKSGDEPISEQEWARTVFPGSILSMSVIMDRLASKGGGNHCPRGGCSGLGKQDEEKPTFKTCNKCGMRFTSTSKMVLEQSERQAKPPHPVVEHGRKSDLDFESDEAETDMESVEKASREMKVFKRVHLQDIIVMLEEVNGGLERRPNQSLTPNYECPFWFLSCSYISRDKEEWKIHSLSHFRGEEPPRSVQCPLCDQFRHTLEDGCTAWNHRMEHVAAFHHSIGETLRTSRPDFPLFQHLWQKRLIDDWDLKELKGGNHNLTRPPINFSIRNGRREGG